VSIRPSLEIRPDDGEVLRRRGWAYLVYDAPRLALFDFKSAIKLNPADADAFCGRGMAQARLGDHRTAVDDALEALRLGKASPSVTYNPARIYAMSATIAASDVSEKDRLPRPLSSRYQDIAVELIREAFEREAPEKRAAFWHDTIEPDPALKEIRPRLKYEELIAFKKKPGT
jgi:tetratricopeptide (TPR) repeat protein